MADVQERDEARDVDEAPAPPQTGLAPADNKPMTRTGAMGFGLAPRNFDEAWRLAGILASSSMVPRSYQNRPNDILVAMQYGAEIGLPPMASLQSVAVINGKPGVYGDGFLGVIQSTSAYAKHKEFYVLASGDQANSLRQEDYQHDDTRAVSMFWRKGNAEPFVAEFSIGDAKRAKLWGKEGPWSQYPARQLLWRARGFAGRNGFAAELRGIKTAEELLDTPEDPDISVEPIGPPAEPVRRSEKALTSASEPSASSLESPTSDVEPAAGSSNGGTAPAAREPRATATAESKPDAAPAGPGQVSKNVHISDTTYVGKPKNGAAAYWEVKGEEIGPNGKPKLGHTWITRDEQLFRMAASCEGSDSLFTVIWHTERQGTAAVKVITGLQGS